MPAWRSRDAWLAQVDQDLATDAVTELRRGLARGPVAVRAITRVAVAVAAAADSDTGRNAMPGIDELVTTLGLSESTVQRALRVLERRGWLVTVRAGKNRLSLDDRLALWASGSAARQQRTVWACTIPTHARHPLQSRDLAGDVKGDPAQPVDNPPAAAAAPESSTARPPHTPAEPTGTDRNGALPTTRRVERAPTEPAIKNINGHNASTTGPSGRAPTTDKPANPADQTTRTEGTYRFQRPRRADGRTVVLAHDLRERLFWLRGCPSWQLRPALDRFARAGWTATDIHHALDRLLATRGWTPLTSPDRPWAYLSWLLRHLEPTDLIADREHAAALAATTTRWHQLRRTGPECPHRMPAGHLPNPHTGQPDCPLCRLRSA